MVPDRGPQAGAAHADGQGFFEASASQERHVGNALSDVDEHLSAV
jgi:hypothetical protein